MTGITLTQGATVLPVLLVMDAPLSQPLARHDHIGLTGELIVNELPTGPLRGSLVLAMEDLADATAAVAMYKAGPVTLTHPAAAPPLASLTHLALGEARALVLNAGHPPEQWTVEVEWVEVPA